MRGRAGLLVPELARAGEPSHIPGRAAQPVAVRIGSALAAGLVASIGGVAAVPAASASGDISPGQVSVLSYLDYLYPALTQAKSENTVGGYEL